ncbi:MAG TPA: hypothetical protein VEC06_14130 [Paucimonas sp.]|nr:hypothetical protein [Paucimonas sp.]
MAKIRALAIQGDRTDAKTWRRLLAASLVAAGLVSMKLGQDANWDWMNYHVYNAWALLHRRWNVDLFAAGIQSYLNPLLDLPYYLLAFEWLPDKPRAVAFLMGLPYGVLAFCTLRCAHAVLEDLAVRPAARLPGAALLAAFGLTGAATLPQVGATFNEIPVAALLIAGVALLLTGLRSGASIPERSFPIRLSLAAGGLFGLAAGLKLTAVLYAPAAVIALACALRNPRRAVEAAAAFSFAWGAGFCISYGWWAWHLHAQTGNPMFPFLENLFGTAWLGSGGGLDHQFKPRSLTQALFYPFHWMRPNAGVVTEPLFADPRFAIAFVVLATACALAAFARRKEPDALADRRMPRSCVFVLAFVTAGYVTWLAVSSIFRYAVAIEALLGPAMGIAIVVAGRRLSRASVERNLIAGMLILLVGSAALTHYPRWGRVRYGDAVLRIEPVKLAPGGLVILLGPPQAYVAPSLEAVNPGVRFIGITDDLWNARAFRLWQEITRRIDAHAGAIHVMVRLDAAARMNLVPELRLELDRESCRDFASSVDQGFRICRARKPNR